MNKKMKLRLSHVQIIALGFLIMIGSGTLLLSLPIATADGEGAGFTMALFTSVSASCVTGFTLQDTMSYWSDFGHVVILLLFQIGGLGVMTIATLFFMLMRMRVGLRQREVMVESLNTTQVGGIMRLLRHICVVTFFAEAIGALVLSIRFIPMFGFGRGLWYGVFHSVSAFCNAGFDLMGTADGSSLSAFAGDWLVNITTIVLIILGGIGFIVINDVCKKGFRFKRYALQSKIVISASAVLIVGGALLFWVFERDNLQAGMSGWEKFITALFTSVSARNAGFVTTDMASLSSGGRMLLLLLMFIGGSPTSTAGGVKTTTIVVILMHTLSGMRHEQSVNIFGRRIEDGSVDKAVAIVVANLVLIFIGVFTICAIQPELALGNVIFEVISAIGTAGMSTGIVRDLCLFSQYIMMALMFLGRLGSVSFAVALLEKRAAAPIRYPVEKITIG